MGHEKRVTVSMLAVCILLAVVVTALTVGFLTYFVMRPHRAERDWEAFRQTYNERVDEKQDYNFPKYPQRTYSFDLAKSYAGPPSPMNVAPRSPLKSAPLSPIRNGPSLGRTHMSAWTDSTLSSISLPLEGQMESERPDRFTPNRFSFTTERSLELKKGRSWKGARLHSHKVSDGSFWS